MGWGSSARRDGSRKVRALPQKFVFLGFGSEEPGMSREFLPGCPPPLGVFKNHEGETHPKKPPTQIKTQLAQIISGQFAQTVPPFFPSKQGENGRKSLRKLFVQTVFIWVGAFLGGLPRCSKSFCQKSSCVLFVLFCQGCRNGRFGKRSFCPLPKTGGFDENWRKF